MKLLNGWQRNSLIVTMAVLCLGTTVAQGQVRRQRVFRIAQPPSVPTEPLPAPTGSSETGTASEPSRIGATDNVATRLVLGVRIAPVTEQTVQQYALAVNQGVLITGIDQGTPADVAGLPIGGVIASIDGIRIESPEQLVRIVKIMDPGQTIELAYYQGSRLFRKSVVMNPTPLPPESAPAPATTASPEIRPTPGLEFRRRPRIQIGRLQGHGGRGVLPPERIGPLLGDIGRIIDEFVGPGGSIQGSPGQIAGQVIDSFVAPTEPPNNAPELVREYEAQPTTEVDQLRAQVRDLQAELQRMRSRVESLERSLSSPVR